MPPLISSEWILSAIRDYIAEAKDADYEMAAEITAAVELMGTLPLWCDWNGGVAIRSDGELIGFLRDDPNSTKVEADPHFRFLACVAGAEKYAELAPLLPKRTGLRDNARTSREPTALLRLLLFAATEKLGRVNFVRPMRTHLISSQHTQNAPSFPLVAA